MCLPAYTGKAFDGHSTGYMLLQLNTQADCRVTMLGLHDVQALAERVHRSAFLWLLELPAGAASCPAPHLYRLL